MAGFSYRKYPSKVKAQLGWTSVRGTGCEGASMPGEGYRM